jgi:hypothetical protein
MDYAAKIQIGKHSYNWMKRGYYERIVSGPKGMEIFIVVPFEGVDPENWRFSYSRFAYTPTPWEYSKLVNDILLQVSDNAQSSEEIPEIKSKPSLVVVK